MGATPMHEPVEAESQVELDIEGMSCASCAARIERKLNRLEGVQSSVNYATERATIHRLPMSAWND